MLAVRTLNVQWFWSIQKYCKSWSWSSGLHLQNVAARAHVGRRNIIMLSTKFYESFLMSIFGVRWLLNCFDLSDELPSSAPSCQHPVEIAIFNGFEPYPCKKSSRISLYLLNNMCIYIYICISYYCRYTYIIIMYHEHSEYSTHTCGIKDWTNRHQRVKCQSWMGKLWQIGDVGRHTDSQQYSRIMPKVFCIMKCKKSKTF